ncbi:MAG: TonB family protein, partial [Saprospiraceae bacterium]|nr:TonB family protein [Saprospiraceae bacterium]
LRSLIIPRKTMTGRKWMAVAATILLLVSISIVFLDVRENAADLPLVYHEDDLSHDLVNSDPILMTESEDAAEGSTNFDTEPIERPPNTDSKEQGSLAVDHSTDNTLENKASNESAANLEHKSDPTVAKRSRATEPGEQSIDMADIDAAGLEERSVGNLIPKDGWQRFREYIKRNLVYPSNAVVERIEGVVHLTFSIDEDGKPIEIKIIRSLGFGCDEEAIRLLQQGTPWEHENSGSKEEPHLGRVSIDFKLP